MTNPVFKVIQKFPNLPKVGGETLQGVVSWVKEVTRIRETDVTLAIQTNQRLDALESIPAIVALTSASTNIAIDLTGRGDFSHLLTENTTLANPSNVTVGRKFSIFIQNNAAAAKTLAYGSHYKFPGGSTPSLTAATNALDRLDCQVRSATVIDSNLVKGLA